MMPTILVFVFEYMYPNRRTATEEIIWNAPI